MSTGPKLRNQQLTRCSHKIFTTNYYSRHANIHVKINFTKARSLTFHVGFPLKSKTSCAVPVCTNLYCFMPSAKTGNTYRKTGRERFCKIRPDLERQMATSLWSSFLKYRPLPLSSVEQRLLFLHMVGQRVVQVFWEMLLRISSNHLSSALFELLHPFFGRIYTQNFQTQISFTAPTSTGALREQIELSQWISPVFSIVSLLVLGTSCHRIKVN